MEDIDPGRDPPVQIEHLLLEVLTRTKLFGAREIVLSPKLEPRPFERGKLNLVWEEMRGCSDCSIDANSLNAVAQPVPLARSENFWVISVTPSVKCCIYVKNG